MSTTSRTTTTPNTDGDLNRRASRRVGRKIGFLIHLLVFVVVNAGLALLHLAQGSEPWRVWPLAGWGLGLAIHGLVTLIALNGEGLRARMVANEVQRLQGR
jgi:2TM domain